MADEARTDTAGSEGPADGSARGPAPKGREDEAPRARQEGTPPASDAVDEAGRESFPASDPPAWTGSSVG